MTTFRVFFENGAHLDVDSDHPDEARSIASVKIKAERGHAVRIAKVKIAKEKVDA